MFGKKKHAEEIPTEYTITREVKKLDEDNLFFSGFKTYTQLIRPGAIDATNPEYVVMDGSYTSALMCTHLPLECERTWLDRLINLDWGVEVYLNQDPQDKRKVNQDITKVLGFTKYKMKQGDNQVDSEIQENAAASSAYMKRRLAEGDEFFFINLLVRVTADSKEGLEEKLIRVENELTGMDILYKRANYRQLEAFLTTMPFSKGDGSIKKITRRNILSSGLKGFFPFVASSLSDPEGMFIGINTSDNSQIILDQFNTDSYNNANMVICGQSGAGKTFTTQLLAARFRMQKIPVMMICPLKGYEYEPLCRLVGGNFFKFAPGAANCINIMDIRPTKQQGREKESYLADKLQRLQLFFTLIISTITEEELRMLDVPLKRAYERYGITMDNASIYEGSGDGVINLKPKLKAMPTLTDAAEEIAKEPELAHIAKQLELFTTGSLSFFNGQTNVDLDNSYIVADISDIPKNLTAAAMWIILDIYWDRIKEDRTKKKAVILDELWKLIGSDGNNRVAEFVLELFKIIRGYGGAAIATTQDINDFFMLEDGKYGKGIINASSIKLIHKLESLDARMIVDTLNLSEEEHTKIEHFEKGQALLCAGSNHLTIQIKAFKTEERLINTDRKKLAQWQKEEELRYEEG